MHEHRVFDIKSLPHPWEDISFFIRKFITCEGHFWIIFNYCFPLLAHLRIGRLINLPHYLLKSLQHMAKVVKEEKHPKAHVTNLALIKLIIMHSLHWQGSSCRALIVRPYAGVNEEHEESVEAAPSAETTPSTKETPIAETPHIAEIATSSKRNKLQTLSRV